MSKGFIKEMFMSVQGEGKYVGALQLFIRFSGCDVGCKGCDTDYSFCDTFDFEGEKFVNPVEAKELVIFLSDRIDPVGIHSVAITGGEPLLQIDFLTELCRLLKREGYKVFLETSGFYVDILNGLSQFLDIVSLDFKLKSTFGVEFFLDDLKKMNEDVRKKVYVKLIVSENISKEDVDKVINGLDVLGKKEIYLHNLNNYNKINMSILTEFYKRGIFAYFIPQVHKFLEIR
ncbi:MAG: 7-carboxy-7-deazaguanine synthase QueE [Calditerrivibrio sp.]|nr:7-carboxy-7-deazaguanine synthase QueE [Calditerrivibrio sp.]